MLRKTAEYEIYALNGGTHFDVGLHVSTYGVTQKTNTSVYYSNLFILYQISTSSAIKAPHYAVNALISTSFIL